MKKSAGVLLYRYKGDELEVFLAHPGGPLWAKKDLGAWTIPKGEGLPQEELLQTARREFQEETGLRVDGAFRQLTPLKGSTGKTVFCFALEGNCNAERITSNSFTMEWPPHSGRRQQFPEVDRAGWFPLPLAKRKIHREQVALLEELCKLTAGSK